MSRAPKPNDQQPLLPSVLDRLIDQEPSQTSELPKSHTQILQELKLSVRRDLENLLNTRWRAIGPPSDLGELEQSLINYGIPDFTRGNLGTDSYRDAFLRIVESAIRKFEPRFKSVVVRRVEDDKQSLERTMHFRIEAMLLAEPAPELVVFDTRIEPASGEVTVQSESK